MRKIVSSSGLFGLGAAIGTWVYHAFTRGINVDTWYRSVFVGLFVFLVLLFIFGLKHKLSWARRDQL